MKKFNLSGVVTISIFTEVEAETLEQAIEIAKNRGIEASQYRDSEQASENWVSDSFDGEPQQIHEN